MASQLKKLSRNVNFVWVKTLTVERKAIIAKQIVQECAAEIMNIVNESAKYATIYVTDPFHWYPERQSQLFVDDEPAFWKETLKNTAETLRIERAARQAQQEAQKKAAAAGAVAGLTSPMATTPGGNSTPQRLDSTTTPAGTPDPEQQTEEPINMKVYRDDQIAKTLSLHGFSADSTVQELILQENLTNSFALPFSMSVVDIPDTTEDGKQILIRLCERFPSLVDVNKSWVLNFSEEHSFFDLFRDPVSLNILLKFVQNITKKQQKMERLRENVMHQFNFNEINLDAVSLDQACEFFAKMMELPQSNADRIRNMNVYSIKVVEREEFEENSKDSTVDSILVPHDFQSVELMECVSRTHTYQPINSSQEDMLSLKNSFTKNVVHHLHSYYSAQKMENPAVLGTKKRKLEEMLQESEASTSPGGEEHQRKRRKIMEKIEALEAELSRAIPFLVETREMFM